MKPSRFLLTLATFVAVLPYAWASPIDPEGLPTIVVDGVTCTLPDAVQAANLDMTVGGCAGSPGIEVLSLEADVTLTEPSAFSATVGGAQAGLPDIASAIVVAGNGHVIERDAALNCVPVDPASFRLFNVLEDGALFLTDVTLRGGCVAPAVGIQAEGGAVHVEGGIFELNGVELEGHQALGTASGDVGAVGGALYCANASITTLSNSSFNNNVARGTDGQDVSTLAGGGGGFFEQCQVGSIEHSSVSGNMAVGSSDRDRSGNGGGLFLRQSTVEVFQHVAFLDNVAQGGDDSSGTSRSADGGGLYLEDSTIQVFSHATFLRNQARGGSSAVSSGSTGEGGAISLAGGSLPVIVQSHFEDNLALGGDSGGDSSPGNCGGGAIRVEGSGLVDGIADSWFYGNTCHAGQSTDIGGGVGADGGAIDLASGEITTIERVTFANNLALGGSGSINVNSDGGAIMVDGSISLLANSTFHGNRAVGGTDNDPDDPGGRGQGGALLVSNPILMMRGNTFVNNVAEGGMGGAGLGPARGGAIALGFDGSTAAGGNLFSGNRIQLADGSLASDDCYDENSGLASEGWNRLESPESCSFGATGDQTGVVTATYPLADWGCEAPLPDGSCVPTVAIDETSPAIDQSSCGDLLLLDDSRSFLRPFDLPAVADAVDGCDVGAFEARDTDGDGFTEATDCAPDDPNVHAVDLCGTCGGDSSACLLFLDGFESGDTLAWDDQAGVGP